MNQYIEETREINNADDKAEKRDKLIYDILKERFQLDWVGGTALDNKTSSIIGFTGILIGLEAWVINSFTFKILNSNYNYLLWFLFIITFLLMGSLLYGLMAFRIQVWKLVPEVSNLIEDYTNTDLSSQALLQALSIELSKSIAFNKEIIVRKASLINKSLGLLVTAIILNIFYIYLVILI